MLQAHFLFCPSNQLQVRPSYSLWEKAIIHSFECVELDSRIEQELAQYYSTSANSGGKEQQKPEEEEDRDGSSKRKRRRVNHKAPSLPVTVAGNALQGTAPAPAPVARGEADMESKGGKSTAHSTSPSTPTKPPKRSVMSPSKGGSCADSVSKAVSAQPAQSPPKGLHRAAWLKPFLLNHTLSTVRRAHSRACKFIQMSNRLPVASSLAHLLVLPS